MSDEITVNVGVTKNLGNFNNVKLDASFRTSIREGEDEDAAFERAWGVVEKEIETRLAEYED